MKEFLKMGNFAEGAISFWKYCIKCVINSLQVASVQTKDRDDQPVYEEEEEEEVITTTTTQV